MNSIGNIAKGVFIGDGALAAFKEISRNKEINKGIFDKTTDSSIRKDNTKNNYPRTSSYYYTQQKLGGKPMELKRFFFGKLVSGYNIDGLDIGWAYTTDVNQTRIHGEGYASSADFDEFQSLLRGEALTRGTIGAKGQNIHVSTRYSDYNALNYTIEEYGNDENWGVRSLKIGDSYNVSEGIAYNNKHKVLKKTHDDYAWIERDKFYTLPNKDNVFLNSHSIKENVNGSQGNELLKYTKNQPIDRKKYKTINEIQELIKPNLKVNTNNVVKESGDTNTFEKRKSDFLVSSNDFKTQFKLKEFKLEDLQSFINEKNKGLNVYSSQYRDYLTETMSKEVGKYINTFILGTFRYSKTKQYALSLTSTETDEYKIYDYGTHPIYNENLNAFQFGAHDSLPYKGIESDTYSLPSGTNKGLINYTHELFKACKINSLINRFQTNLQHAKETLSRGRNLKAKKIATTEGYSNPYSRVWTAVHQYSTMKDVIRPFYGDVGTIPLFDIQNKLPKDMRPNNGATKLRDNSVLQDNGFVRITPTEKTYDKLKNYMFSIENLAWKDNKSKLSKEQEGPNGGRIMWFPPYNLKFSENVNVSWNGNSFIGRGEQIYTYTNTERSGTLDFTLLIDHPSMLNTWRGIGTIDNPEEKEQELLRFFAGCEMLEPSKNIETIEEKEEIEVEVTIEEVATESVKPAQTIAEPTTEAKPAEVTKRIAYIIFYPDSYPLSKHMHKDSNKGLDMLKILKDLCKYETSDDLSKNTFTPTGPQNQNIASLNTNLNYVNDDIRKIIGGDEENLDVKFLINDIIKTKVEENSTEVAYNTDAINGNNFFGYDLNQHEIKTVEYHGISAAAGETERLTLTLNRLDLLKELLNKIGVTNKLTEAEIKEPKYIKANINDEDKVNSLEAKYGRVSFAVISLASKMDLKVESEPEAEDSLSVQGQTPDGQETPKTRTEKKIITKITEKELQYPAQFDNEYLYFTEITKDEKIIQSILNRVRHFDPAFHSLTPEGFNARLTFLHQCTRQGPTAEFGSNNSQGGSAKLVKTASNLSFGRAPYCILRIGDFFNTKICIDSVSINYDTDGGPQWDLNPEGVGVQPMFANVSINFKFLGGQDIAGPVAKLQNAITSNYYANASVYDNNAKV